MVRVRVRVWCARANATPLRGDGIGLLYTQSRINGYGDERNGVVGRGLDVNNNRENFSGAFVS
jgi:hypothetical protein